MSNVLNYFSQPGSDGDNELVLTGTVTFSGTVEFEAATDIDFVSVDMDFSGAASAVDMDSDVTFTMTGSTVVFDEADVDFTGTGCTVDTDADVTLTITESNVDIVSADVDFSGAGCTVDFDTNCTITFTASTTVFDAGTVDFTNAGTVSVDGSALEVVNAGRLTIDASSLEFKDLTQVTFNDVNVTNNIVFTKTFSANQAEINAGTIIQESAAGYRIKVLDIELIVTGNFATGTSVDIEDSSGTVSVLSVAQAGLLDGAMILPDDASATRGAGFWGDVTTGENLVIIKKGLDFTGGTSIAGKLTYTIVTP